MAAIREELVLADRFSATFNRFTRFLEKSTNASKMAAASQNMYKKAITSSSAAIGEMASSSDRAVQALEEINSAVQRMAEGTSSAADQQEKVNKKFREGSSAADKMAGKLKQLIATYASFQGIKTALDWVGENLTLSNIQRNAENQLKAVLANTGAQAITVPVTADFSMDVGKTMSSFDAIAAKASAIQGRGIYGDESMIAGAAEFATYFSDTNAILSMMDTLSNYAMGMSGGGAIDKNAMVEYATGLGKIMSGSYDAMTQKGFEFTNVQKAIIEGTATQAQITAELGSEYLSMSHDMQAAATINSVIAESWGGLYEAMSDTPEGKIIQLQNKLGDLREMLGDRIYPAVLQVVDVLNSNYPKIEQGLTAFSDLCSGIVLGISWIAQGAMNLGSVFMENGDLIISVLIGCAVAFGVVKAASVASALASAAAWAVAHWPLLLIAAAVVGIIQRALQMGATWQDVCGFMGSVLYELYAIVYNITADTWNLFAMFAEFFANFMNDPIGSIVRLVFDAFDWILGIVETTASAIDALFGKNFSGAVAGFRDDIRRFAADTFGENEIKITRMEKLSYADAWTQGNELGRRFYNDLSSLNGMSLDNFTGSALTGISNRLDSIGDDTAAIKRSVALSEEDMKLLVDMAERQYVNNINLTAKTPVINITGQNTGNSAEDLQWLENALKSILMEEAASHTDLSYQ